MNDTEANVLVVDDERRHIDSLLEQLERTGYRLDVAEGGLAAWKKLEASPERYDVVLLDRTMPDLGGLEVLRRMKQHSLLRSVPVILQTSRRARHEILEGLQAGAYYYLTKPFDPAMLMGVLQTAVEDRQRYRRAQEDRRAAGRTFGLMREATFAFRSLTAARELAVVLANACPDPKRVAIGLTELLINAVEHGNLGITYDEKSRLRDTGGWREELEARMVDPRYANREVVVTYRREGDCIRVRIKDQGEGFDFARYLEMDPARVFDSHGRGIAISRLISFDSVRYCGCGNEVEVTVRTGDT